MGLNHRQRTQEHSVDDAEHRRSGADREAERDDGDDAHGRVPADLSPSEDGVCEERFKAGQPPLIPQRFDGAVDRSR